MKLTKHNVEQMARGYLMYELARRGYWVQLTDSRFPTCDILVVSPKGRHFGIEVKGQSTKNFWLFSERQPNPEMYYAFVFVPREGTPRVFVMNSSITMRLWKERKSKALKKPAKHHLWGLNWTGPHEFEDRYDLLPR